jgi:hypothetical protein
MTRLLTLALCGALLVACGDDNGTGPENPPSVTGAWTLSQVDGNGLPVTTTVNGVQVTINAGAITFTANGGYSGTLQTDLGAATDQGSYTQDGSAIALTSTTPGADPASGTVSGSTLTLRYGSPPAGPTFTFTK